MALRTVLQLVKSRLGHFGTSLAEQSVGVVLSQVIPVLIAPLLTRFFSPVDFGLYGLIVSMGALLGIVITLRIDHGVMVCEQDQQALRIGGVALTIAVPMVTLSAALAGLVLWIVGNQETDTWIVWCILIPSIGYLTALCRILTLYQNRTKQFGQVARARIVQAMVVAASSLFFGITSWVSNGLIIALVLGYFIYAAIVWVRPPELSTLKLSFIMASLRDNLSFIRFSLPADLVNVLSTRLPFLLFPMLFGLEQTGYLALAYRVIATPSRFIGSAMGEVFYSFAAREYRESGQCWTLTRNVALALTAFGLIGFSVLFIFAEPIFSLAFGSEWIPAASFVQILTPMLFLGFIVSPLGVVFYITSRQKDDFIWQISYISLATPACFAGMLYGGASGSLITYSMVGSGLYLVYFRLVKKHARGNSGRAIE